MLRKIKKILNAKPTVEGAGVRLKRVFGNPEMPLFDPFLLMDDFHSDTPEDYMAGFPMHPHRGIETITYMIHGAVTHRDSMGNEGTIHSGDIQWMTAGSGVIHEEMPQKSASELWGFQLWANLPAAQKMMPPRYQDVPAKKVPSVFPQEGVEIKVICGEVNGVKGPVREIITEPEYLDIAIQPRTVFKYAVRPGDTVFAYVMAGEAVFGDGASSAVGQEHAVLFEDGDTLHIATNEASVRFLLVSGKPIGEPVAWYGPIVMNTDAEIKTALKEYQSGTFLK
ncbi:MAG: pirin family protein [Nitrospiria bacterium]